MSPQSTSADQEYVRISPARMTAYARAIFAAAGTGDEVAERMARSLVLSNQSGHDSHGVIRITQYLREIQKGELDPRAEPAVVKEGPAWALVDGRWAFGQETARFSMAQAIRLAGKNGVGLVSAVRCMHIGRLGEWAEQAAAAGMIGMACVSLGQKSSQTVTPYGGAGRALSTNPLAIGVPRADEPPLLLDFATSVSAEGKVRVARDKGMPLPPGCIVDRNGNPSTNPNDLYAGGALLPVGGHKGYALAVMVDVFGLALGGADAPDMHGPTGVNSGSWYQAIDPSVFRPFADFSGSVDRIAERVTSVPPAPGFESVMLPGEPELRARQERAESISLPIATWNAIAESARSVGVTPPTV